MGKANKHSYTSYTLLGTQKEREGRTSSSSNRRCRLLAQEMTTASTMRRTLKLKIPWCAELNTAAAAPKLLLLQQQSYCCCNAQATAAVAWTRQCLNL